MRFDNELDQEVSEGIDAPTATAAYLIIGEALANLTQHAHATTGTVRLTEAERMLVMEVSDDGVGIDANRVPTGIGLASMRGRALEPGGDVVITAGTPGTIVTATLPLRREDGT